MANELRRFKVGEGEATVTIIENRVGPQGKRFTVVADWNPLLLTRQRDEEMARMFAENFIFHRFK